MSPPDPTHSDALLLGYAPMDQMHQEFLDGVAALAQCDDALVNSSFLDLKAHLQTHFDQEDGWMRETGFPAAECHTNEHAEVMKSVHQVEALLKQGDTAICRRLAAELATWFPVHATYLDSALSQWMCKRQFGGAPVVLHRKSAKAAGV